ncbi:MAG TPA: branched-chain amino acid ABC transporter substrate-binding protein [Methylomirabilota bacterium]|nr:branched-chain amino acid ABC transporter substrate-binding protein [Methylomirabilota bacterium]
MARRIRTVTFLLVGLLAAWSDPARAQLQGQVIRIGIGAPLTGGAATFGVEMKNAVELAIEEQNGAGGVLGARLEAAVFDDEASDAKGQAGAGALCQDPAVLAVVGHVNSNVSITASNVYAGCGLAMLTPMSSNPGVTDRGLANVFRLTNRDDYKGPGLAAHLYRRVGKRRAVVVDDQTAYGKGLADLFAGAFASLGGTVVARPTVKVGDRDFQALLAGLPPDFDVMFFGGIAEAAYLLKQMRERGLNQLFACGDGCWNVKGFIQPAAGATTKGEGVLILSAAPAIGRVPGSAAFAERYTKRFGPIANYAVNSYDSARLVVSAIQQAASVKGGLPTRGEVVAALRKLQYQGIAYARPVAWDAKGDNTAAVIFVNVVEADRFKEIGEITRSDMPN